MKTILKVGLAFGVALIGSSVAASAQGYPQQQQGYPQQQQGYPQQQQGYGAPQDRDHEHDRDRGGWDAPPDDFRNDIQRQGFRDGIQGARQDFENHVRPNYGIHQEYRHPQVPRPARDDYRAGYQRGYNTAVQHMRDHRDGDHGDDHRDGDHGGYQPR